MKFNIEKLKEIAKPLPEKDRQNMECQIENQDWLMKSVELALKIRRLMREADISQSELARRMKVSPAQIVKILSGKENLGLRTIAKVEKALGKSLYTIAEDNHEVSICTTVKYEPLPVFIESKPVKQTIDLSYTVLHKTNQPIFS